MTGEQLFNMWRDEFGNNESRSWLDLLGAERDKWERIAEKARYASIRKARLT